MLQDWRSGLCAPKLDQGFQLIAQEVSEGPELERVWLPQVVVGASRGHLHILRPLEHRASPDQGWKHIELDALRDVAIVIVALDESPGPLVNHLAAYIVSSTQGGVTRLWHHIHGGQEAAEDLPGVKHVDPIGRIMATERAVRVLHGDQPLCQSGGILSLAIAQEGRYPIAGHLRIRPVMTIVHANTARRQFTGSYPRQGMLWCRYQRSQRASLSAGPLTCVRRDVLEVIHRSWAPHQF